MALYQWCRKYLENVPPYIENTNSWFLSVPAQVEQPSQPEGVLSAFAAISLDPPSGPSSPIQSSYSTGPFSLREELSDNATDLDSWAAESDNSGSDDEEINDVIQMLDIRLVSVLGGDLDIAARLIPKIHDLLDSDLDAGIPNFSEPFDQDYTSHQGGGGSKGKQKASGGSPSAPSNQNASSGSSPQKHGRASEDSNERRDGRNSNKRPRREPDRNSDLNGNGSADENGADDQKEGASDMNESCPSADVDRDPGDPRDDPVHADVPSEPPDFACHFHKRDHINYGPWNKKYAMCSSCRMEKLRRIK